MSPTDAEAWAELSDLYVAQGLYPQAIFALEEVLVLSPNAWNVSVPLSGMRRSEQGTDPVYSCTRDLVKFF